MKDHALLKDLPALLKPNFHTMTPHDRALRIVLMAYLKHSDNLAGRDIGWNELMDEAHDVLCNHFGSDEVTDWGERLDEPNRDESGDVEMDREGWEPPETQTPTPTAEDP